MKLLVMMIVLTLSVSAFATGTKVKKVENCKVHSVLVNDDNSETDIDPVNVCSYSTETHEAIIAEQAKAACECDKKETPEELNGDGKGESQCNTDKKAGKEVKEYKVDENGNVQVIKQ